ncbi:MAG: hypothetical protein GQ531_06810 [Sulfurovum sp.]|nr:hypothetical protein [Sulfurovum sp.]
MNQTKKRLSIIKLAISITDLETIQLQSLKLSPLQSDVQIQDILTLLASDNFAQAQSLISHYIEYAPEEVVQRTHINVSQGVSVEDQAIIDEFNLIVTNAPEASAKNEEVDINDFLSYIPEPEEALEQSNLEEKTVEEDTLQENNQALYEEATHEPKQEDEPESLDEIVKEEETLEENAYDQTENDEIDSHPEESSTDDSFFASSEETPSNSEEVTEEQEDDFFKLETREEVFAAEEEMMFQEKKLPQEEESLDAAEEEETELAAEMDADTQALFSHVEEENLQEDPLDEENMHTIEESSDTEQVNEGLKPLEYEAMPHISLKLMDMKRRYPAIQKTYEKFESIEDLIQSISQTGYSEAEIQEALESTKTLIANAQYTQAAQLLLVCAATESKFAQFMLARELYVGSVLSKNVSESFALMSTLAIDDYPEALCDLGQFYENGIATKADVTKAEELYKGALDAGIQRANRHYIRITKKPRSFFSV